jgi:chromosomal replication initiation ATPase DnaA
MTSYSPETTWDIAKSELKNQMTAATFNTWLADATYIGFGEGVFEVAVANTYAIDWLSNRLYDTILRTLRAVHGREDVDVRFSLKPPSASYNELSLSHPPTQDVEPVFPGFESYRSNFVQVPKQFFEIVLPKGPSVVTAFVGAVISETIGTIVNTRTAERREWWEASYEEIGRVSGIQSKASIGKAVRLARQMGYVKRAKGIIDYKYRLRDIGESVDD